jgi:hypothetical protein
MELIMEAELLPRAQVEPLHLEASELTAIFTASVRSTIRNQQSTIRNHRASGSPTARRSAAEN